MTKVLFLSQALSYTVLNDQHTVNIRLNIHQMKKYHNCVGGESKQEHIVND